VAARFVDGASIGMRTVAVIPSSDDASATAWGWFPDNHAPTPRVSCSDLSDAI
jgi:hypothetical protein